MRLARIAMMVVAFALVFGTLVVAISTVQNRMNLIRESEGLTDTTPLENAPPMVAFTTIALGGFRGLLADWLWLRSTRMQDEGNYFEMFQLASWIVKLQPRFTGATAFLAWNMAYNISVTFSNFEDRWRWVQRGIELIRDEALLYNPGDPELFRELGWIFQHKLGKDLDDANRHYKTQWAMSMIRLFGEYPPDWQALVAAPRSEAALRDALGPDTTFWSILAARDMRFADLEQAFRRDGGFGEELGAELERDGLRQTVEQCLRRRWMIQVYKLEPSIVATLVERYGALDFRLPEAHAVYWAWRGLAASDDEIVLSCDRMIFQSLNAAFQGGRLVYVREIELLEMTPNIALVDAVNQAYLDAIEKHGEQRISGGYENFLIDAVVVLYSFGQQRKAREYLDMARRRFGDGFRRPLEEFVLGKLAEDIEMASYNQAQGTVNAYLMQACHAVAVGDLDRGLAFERIADRIWRKYMDSIGETTHRRRGLPPYAQMKRNALIQAIRSFPPVLAEVLRREFPGAEEAMQSNGLVVPPLAPGAEPRG